jgi:ethanolamine utilization protein EutN
VVLPMPLEAFTVDSPKRGEDVIAYDDLGSGPGAFVGLSEGREAANPFGKVKTPVDAFCACILDQLSF